ncbi:MAG: hypothetical protein DBY22_00595 [Clostridiales bacterium]|nr:MAG: hypothetical protein DBY22_00595 [Clostridiales bacterium]
MEAVLTEIIELLTGGLTGMATGIGAGLGDLAKSIFLETTGEGASATTTLSVFGALIIIFAGVSLAIGLSRWVVNWVTSLGN